MQQEVAEDAAVQWVFRSKAEVRGIVNYRKKRRKKLAWVNYQLKRLDRSSYSSMPGIEYNKALYSLLSVQDALTEEIQNEYYSLEN